jgi:hypothetical protein
MPASANSQPKRPLQNALARSASSAGSSKWTILPGIAAPFCGGDAKLYALAMIRVSVLYEQVPDASEYEQHAELCRAVPGGTFRHGKVLGGPGGHETPHAYYAEWEFPDRESFDAAVGSDEYMQTGRDARDRGLPRPTVEFIELA